MTGRRHIPADTYFLFYAIFAAVLFLMHSPFLKLPYFWDEMGSIPPGLTAFLNAIWSIASHSITTTRVAMLLVAAAGLLAVFLLAIRLSASMKGAPAFAVAVLLLLSPLFYAQSMLALPDMPAMLFTCLALLLFLQDRPVASAAACTALVLVRETGLIVPLVLAAWLVREKRGRDAAYFLAPACALAAWILQTKPPIDRALYLLHPVRFPIAIVRRLYYLFVQDFHWVGTLAIVSACRRTEMLRIREWRVAASLVGAHVLVFSLFGASILERHLLPVLPLVYMAMVAGFATLPGRWRLAAQSALALGLVAGNLWNPPYPFPLDDNTAFTDFVKLQKSAAEFIEFNYPVRRVVTAWPLAPALARPELGYVLRGLRVRPLPDFHADTLAQVDWSQAGVFVLFSRTWDPPWNLLHLPPARWIAERYFDYQPDLETPPAAAPLEHVAHFAHRGQWVDVYATPRNPCRAPCENEIRRSDAVQLRYPPQPLPALASLR